MKSHSQNYRKTIRESRQSAQRSERLGEKNRRWRARMTACRTAWTERHKERVRRFRKAFPKAGMSASQSLWTVLAGLFLDGAQKRPFQKQARRRLLLAEGLEDRRLLAFTTLNSGVLSVDFSAESEAISVANNGTTITLTSNVPITGAGATFPTSVVSGFVFTDSGDAGRQRLTFSSGTPLALSNGLSSSGIESVNVHNDVTSSGSSSVEILAPHNIYVSGDITGGSGGVDLQGLGTESNPNASVSAPGVDLRFGAIVTATGAGPVSIQGIGGSNNSDRIYGVRLLDAGTTVTSGGGDVFVSGKGGSGTGDKNWGVWIGSGATVTAGGLGDVEVSGVGGTGSGGSLVGVRVQGEITSAGGDVVVNGTGGQNATGSWVEGNHGIELNHPGIVTSGGSGSVTVSGIGRSSGGNGAGNGVEIVGGTITSGGMGDVTVTGQSTSGGQRTGVYLKGSNVGGAITSGGGNVTVVGQGDSTGVNTFGVWAHFPTQITSGGGTVNVTGTGSGDYEAVRLEQGGSIQSGNDAPITITADSFRILGGSSGLGTVNSGLGTATLRNRTAGTTINVGGTDVYTNTPPTLGLSTTELNQVTAGTLVLGRNDATASGDIVVSNNIARSAATNMHLVTGGDILISGGQINAGGGSLQLTPGASPAAVKPTRILTDVIASTVSIDGDLAVEINGTTADTDYNRLSVTGDIDLTNTRLAVSGTYQPVPGDAFTIVDNQGSAAITGIFDGLPEGASVVVNGGAEVPTISYDSGDGNDVVVSVFLANQQPTDLELSNQSIAENVPLGSVVGNFSTSDPNSTDTFTYELVRGVGDDDNASFTISGDQLLTAELFDLDTQSSFWIRVRSTDQGGLATEKAIAIIIVDFQLLKDINPNLWNASSNPRYYTEVGESTFFVASTVTHGTELWKTDGTASGTELVKNIAAGADHSSPTQLTNVDGTLYFIANDGTHGIELWKSDGTEAGTELLKDINAGSTSAGISELTVVNGNLFFRATDGVHGSELWKTDGTETGTVMVKDIRSGSSSSSPANLINVNGSLFFSANDGINGSELWKTDGTEAGTLMVTDIRDGSSGSYPSQFTNVGGTVYFRANNGLDGTELWKTNGTEAGTAMVRDIASGLDRFGSPASSSPQSLTNVNGTLVFRADDGVLGAELWKTDGTEIGTVMVKDIRVGEDWRGDQYGSDISTITNVSGTLYFVANDGIHGPELWKSDGTAAGTVLVSDIRDGSTGSYPRELTTLNGMLFFQASDGVSGTEIWTTDGTEAGTTMLLDIRPGSPSSISGGSAELTIINGLLYFSAIDDVHGREVWTSDGTAAGTSMFKDIRSETRNGGIGDLTDVNGTLFFRADDGVNGSELWKSDGTSAGTVMIQDTNPGPAAGQPTGVTRVDTSLFYVTNDGTHGRELWKSDGTDAGTVMIKNINPNGDAFPAYLVEVNGTVFFSANDGTNGTELWKSDGTAAGTVRVKDINPGSGSSSPSELTAVDGVVYFRANDGSNGSELWKSDGTAAGTMLVKDIRSGSNGSSAGSLTNLNGKLFFRAYDGVNGTELWKSDGTESGTVIVKDIRPGGSSGSANNLTNLNGTLFFTSNDGSNGAELWRSDGTEAGTLMVKDIYPGSSRSSISNAINLEGTLFFAANDGTHGAELWKSDGTEAGTTLVKDIFPGMEGASIREPANVNGALYFRASDGVNGVELWRSDGTESGTMMVANITGDTGSSTPGTALEINGNIFVSATTEEYGQELFRFVESPVYPTVNLTSGDFTIDEDVGLATITAELDEAVAFEITVPLVVESDTATIGRDLLQLGSAFTFLPGETTASLNISITDDQGFEEAEAFTVAVGASVGVQMGSELQNTITIQDNDSIPLVSFRTPWQITPETVQDVPIEVLLNNTSYQDITVPLTFDGSAEAGSDYLLLEGSSVVIPAGQLVGQTTVRLIDDTLPERTELLIVGIDTPINGIISDSQAASLEHVVTVQQNDSPTVSFSSIQQSVSEDAGTIAVEAELSYTTPLEVRIPFLVGGSSTDDDRIINHDPIHSAPVIYEIVIPPNQLTGSISVTIIDDELSEPGRDERVAFKMGAPTNALLGSTSTTVVTIQDNDIAKVSFTVDSQQVWEDAGTATITVSTSNVSTKSIRVPISVSGLRNVEDGQAEYETDFDLATTALVIPAGATSVSRQVTIIDDSDAEETERTEPTEFAVVGLGRPTNGQLARTNRTHTLKILDNDPLVSVEASLDWIRERNTTSSDHPYFTVSLTAPTNSDVTIPFSVAGTATEGADYNLSPAGRSITIPAGQTARNVTLFILEDTLDEFSETVELAIGDPTGGAIYTPGAKEKVRRCRQTWNGFTLCTRFTPPDTTNIAIYDDDAPPSIFWQTSNSKVSEDRQALTYTIGLNRASAKDVKVELSFKGTARDNEDYTRSILNRVKIEAGETSTSFRVFIEDDLGIESTEEIVMRMEDASNASLPRNKTKFRARKISITDNDRGCSPPAVQHPGTFIIEADPQICSGQDEDVGFTFFGGAAKGLLDGSTAYFDANFNGALDFLDLNDNGVQDEDEPSEPSAPTKLDGSFTIQVPAEFDVDEDGVISTPEGRWLLTGGVDSAVGLPFRLRLTSALDQNIITPLSTVVERLVTLNGYQLADAEARMLEAFSIGGTGLGSVNPVQGTFSGDPRAALIEATSVRIATSVQQVADLFAGVPASPSVDFFSDLVFTTLANAIAPADTFVDLSVEAIVSGVIDSISTSTGILLDPNPVTNSEIVSGAAQIIAAGNQAIDAIENTVDLTYLERLFQVKKVMLGDASPAFGEVTEGTRTIASAVSEFTGANLQAKIDQAAIGMIVPPTVVALPGEVIEGDSGQQMLEMVVQLVGDHNQHVSVDYTTQDDTALSGSGDYVAVQGTLSWAPGDNSDRTVLVPINGNSAFSPDKNFILVLSNPTAAVIGDAVGYGFIVNDDELQHTSSSTPPELANSLVLELVDNEFTLVENDEVVSSGGIALQTTITLSGQDSLDDTFELDLSESFIDHDVSFHGGVSGEDTVEISEGVFQSVTHAWTGNKSGSTQFLREDSEQPLTFSWSDIESFVSQVSATELFLDLPFGTTDAILEDADPADDTQLAGMMRLRSASDAFEPIVFANPATSIVVRGAGVNFLTIDSQDPAFTGPVDVVENYEPDPPGEVEVIGGDLVVTMPGQATARMTIGYDSPSNQLVISSTSLKVTAGNGTTQAWDAGVVVPMSSITGTLIVNGSELDDVLTLDFAGGNPIPAGGLTFSGGIGNNALRLSGTGSEDPVYTPDPAVFGDGQIDVGGRNIQFSGVEPVDFDNAGSVTLMLPGTDDVVHVASGFLADGFIEASVISGSSGGIAFSEARVSGSAIVIDTTQVDGDDSVVISSGDNLHGNTGLTITTGSHNDTVSVDGSASFAGPVSIYSPNIVLNADLGTTAGTTAGDMSLTGSVVVNVPVVLNTSRVAGSGNLQVDGSLLLSEALTVTSGTGDVSLLGTVDGQHPLIIESQGATVFSSDVGSVTPLTGLSVDSGGTTSVTNVTTIGLQNYGNDLLIDGILTTTNETVSVAGSTTVAGPTMINTGNGLVSFNGGLNLTASTEITGDQIVIGNQLGFEIDGPAIDTQYPQLTVSSAVELAGVDLITSGTYQPTIADNFHIVSNESPNPFVGTFEGMDQWALVTINDGANQKEVTYVGGDGNDISLVRANTAPTALDDEVSTNEETSLLIDVLANNGNGADSDDESNLDLTLTVNLSSPSRGTLVNNADGTFTFNPDGDFEFLAVGESTTESFTYRIEDTRGETATAVVTITVNGTNDLPAITLENGDSASRGLGETDSGLTATGTLTVADVDLTDTVATAVDSLTLGGTGAGNVPGSLTAEMLEGFMTVESGNVIGSGATTGKINWSFDSGSEAFNFLATGQTLILTYTLSATDSQNVSVTRDVVVTLTGSNDVPAITLESGDSNQETLTESNGTLSSSGKLSASDSDVADEVSVSAISVVESGDVSGIDNATLLAMMTTGTNPVIDDTSTSGTINWTFNSGSEAFDYLAVNQNLALSYTLEAVDGTGGKSTSSVMITVTGTNDGPVAVDDNFAGDEDTVISGNVNTNDTDVDLDSLTFALDSSPSNGGIVFNSDGTFGYTPASDFSGSDSFTYIVSDGNGSSDSAIANITVAPVNDPPELTLPPEALPVVEGQVSNLGTLISVVDKDVTPGVGSQELTLTITVPYGLASLPGAFMGSSHSVSPTSVVLTGSIEELMTDLALITFAAGDADSMDTTTLSVTLDDNGLVGGGSLTDSGSIDFNITDAAPSLELSGASSHNEGSTPYELAIGGFADPAGTTEDPLASVIIRWGDGSVTTIDNSATMIDTNSGPVAASTLLATLNAEGSVTLTHVYDDDELYTGDLGVDALTDGNPTQFLNAGQFTDSRSVNLVVQNVAPTATVSAPTPWLEGTDGIVSVDATDASMADVADLLFDYDFGNDGTYEIENTTDDSVTLPASFLEDNGLYTVAVRIKDQDGGETVQSLSQNVGNANPVLEPIPGVSAIAGLPTTISGSFSDIGLADNPWTIEVDWDGNGTSDESIPTGSQGAFSIDHTFETAGTFNVTVRVTDKDGGQNEVAFIVTVAESATIADRKLFYNGADNGLESPFFTLPNTFDSSGAASGAIDTSKSALVSGTSTNANYSNYSRGLNGIIIDVNDLAGSVTASDFTFEVWDGFSSGGFSEITAGSVGATVEPVLAGQGESGSDRLKLTFANNAIENTWLRVTMKSNSNTGLASDDVFYFGHAHGDVGVGNPMSTGSFLDGFVLADASDTNDVRTNQLPTFQSADITNPRDVNKDGRVDAADTQQIRSNQTPTFKIKHISV